MVHLLLLSDETFYPNVALASLSFFAPVALIIFLAIKLYVLLAREIPQRPSAAEERKAQMCVAAFYHLLG